MFLQKLIDMFISKKKVIAYVSAVLIALAAAVLGISSQEVKEAIVSGPVIDLPKASEAPVVAPAVAPPAEKKK